MPDENLQPEEQSLKEQPKPDKYYNKWWFWVIIAVFVIAVLSNIGGDKDAPAEPTEEVIEETVEPTVEPEETPDVPREYRNALKAAQNYIDNMPFSEAGLYKQLTSEYGEQYPEDAARYALENVKVDYNEEALEAAKGYQELLPMSDKELFDQLTSAYGEEFTPEQAQYAIDNLPD